MSKMLDTAKKLAWPAGTKSSKYSYKKGKPTKAYSQAFKKLWPKGTKSQKSNCDRSAALVARIATGEKVPTGNEDQLTYKPKKLVRKVYKNVAPASVSKPGDLIVVKKKNGRHTMIDGNGCLYEAQHNKTFFHTNSSRKKLKTKRPKVVIFREK